MSENKKGRKEKKIKCFSLAWFITIIIIQYSFPYVMFVISIYISYVASSWIMIIIIYLTHATPFFYIPLRRNPFHKPHPQKTIFSSLLSTDIFPSPPLSFSIILYYSPIICCCCHFPFFSSNRNAVLAQLHSF